MTPAEFKDYAMSFATEPQGLSTGLWCITQAASNHGGKALEVAINHRHDTAIAIQRNAFNKTRLHVAIRRYTMMVDAIANAW